MQRTNFKPLTRVILFLALAAFAPVAPAQTIYTFTKIADTNFFFSNFSAPSLNDAGKVAFNASARDQRSGIFSGDGTETGLGDYVAIVIQQPGTGVYVPGSYVGSRVAFSRIVNPQTGTGGIFSSDGVNPQTIIVDPTIVNVTLYPPLMNRAGQVAYLGGGTVDLRGIYVAQNGSSQPVYTIPAFFTRGPVEMHNVFEFGNTQVTDAGAILFEGDFFNLPVNPTDPEIDFGGLVQGGLNGGLPTLLVTDGLLSNGDFQSLEEFAGNNGGQVACIVSVSDDIGLYYRLLRVNGGAATSITDTRSGPFLDLSFGGSRSLTINDNGTIIFVATFKDVNGVTQTGLFTGPDPVNDKVIATGDPLFGSVVGSITFDRVGFNNQGQVAFRAALNNGNSMVVRADPSNGGTTVEWVGAGSGSFDVSSNWQPTNGDPPRVPTRTVTISDTALFDRAEAYTVDFGGNQQHVERLVVKDGNVLFANGSIKADATSPEIPSVEIDNARLGLLTAMSLTNNHALIGSSGASRVDVGVGGEWVSLGSLHVGGAGQGILNIEPGGTVVSAESLIGTGVGGGQAIVGNNGSWDTGAIAIGAGGTGELIITNSGHVNSTNAIVGLSPGLGNKVTVTGFSDPTNYSQWHVENGLIVGHSGAGTLEINDGGSCSVSLPVIIGDSQASGTVKVTGVPSTNINASSYLNASAIIVGKGGLSVEDGAFVQADYLQLKGPGTVKVLGVNAATGRRSDLTLLGDPLVETLVIGGPHGSSSLVVGEGALMHTAAGNVKIGDDPSAPACKIDIIGLSSNPTSTLQVDNNLELGKVGPSTITLSNGRLEVGGTLTVWANGFIQGNGALIAGTRVKNGGYISPGLSPGRLILEGDYEQTAGGRLKIEVGGPDPGVSHDQFVVNGAATLDGSLELRFINGFAPRQGDTFNFLQVGGALSNGFATVEVKNLAPDFQFNVSTNGTNVSLVAVNDGVFVTPLQGQISSSNVVTIGGITYLPYALNVTNDCTIVEPVGSITRQGQELFQTLGERADPKCAGSNANASRILVLGALAPGSYQFHFMSDGVVVYTVSFNVLSGTDQVLSFTRTAGGELNLQINGLDSVQYTIQASADMTDWFDLPTHVGTFLGPYNIFEPFFASKARFYRVKIE